MFCWVFAIDSHKSFLSLNIIILPINLYTVLILFRAYEPIPLNIRMETWRKMSKKEILKTVNSKQMRKDFEYMSHSEILGHIEKMHTSAKYLSNKFGVDHLLQHNHPPLTKRQLERAKQKGRPVDLESIIDSDFTNSAAGMCGVCEFLSNSLISVVIPLHYIICFTTNPYFI